MSKHIPGIGCQCCAHSENECCCPDVDWRSAREVELEALVEKLTKERDIKEHCITQFELEDLRMKEQLAALAEQNEKLKECLSHYAVYQTAYGTKNAAAKLLEELK